MLTPRGETASLLQQSRDATWIIGGDESSENCQALYHDSRGVSRVYQMSLNNDVWKIWRNAPDFNQRFTGTLIDGGHTIVGEWELSRDGSIWETDFDLTYTRVD